MMQHETIVQLLAVNDEQTKTLLERYGILIGEVLILILINSKEEILLVQRIEHTAKDITTVSSLPKEQFETYRKIFLEQQREAI